MIRSLIHTALVVGLLTSCASTTKNKNRATYLLRSGTSFLEAGRYPDAIRDLQLAEQLDPKNPVIHNNLGLAYFVRDKFIEAERHLRLAVELAPAYTDARNNHARSLIELAQYEAAIEELQIVLKDLTYPEPERAWFNFGLAYFRRGQFPTAREKFAEAIRINRNHCLAHTFYGRCQLELGEFEKAADSLDSAVGICNGLGKHDEPQYYSGISYYKLGRTDKAVARMEEIIRLNPEGRYAKRAQSMLQLMLK